MPKKKNGRAWSFGWLRVLCPTPGSPWPFPLCPACVSGGSAITLPAQAICPPRGDSEPVPMCLPLRAPRRIPSPLPPLGFPCQILSYVPGLPAAPADGGGFWRWPRALPLYSEHLLRHTYGLLASLIAFPLFRTTGYCLVPPIRLSSQESGIESCCPAGLRHSAGRTGCGVSVVPGPADESPWQGSLEGAWPPGVDPSSAVSELAGCFFGLFSAIMRPSTFLFVVCSAQSLSLEKLTCSFLSPDSCTSHKDYPFTEEF